MRKKTNSKPKKLNRNLKEVAAITGKSYGYVKQVACGKRSNTMIERAIIAFDEQDFATLMEIQQEISKTNIPAK